MLSLLLPLAPLLIVWLAWLLTLPPRPDTWLVVSSGLPILTVASWLTARHRGKPWVQSLRETPDAHLLALVLLIAFGVQFEDAHGVTTDGVIYFTQLRSVLFNGDLDVGAEFAFLGQPPRPSHVVPIGPTLVWLPLYAMVAAADAVGRGLGWWTGPDNPAGAGLTLPYVRAALVSSFAIGAAGLAVVHNRLRAEFTTSAAFLTTILVFAATPLVWYMVYEPSMTHAASFGFVALFVAAADRWTSLEISPARGVILGALIGLAFITRPQEALFALFPAILLVWSEAPWRARLLAAARLAGWAFLGAVPFLVLQGVHSTILMSRESFAIAGDSGYLDLLHSRWADTLWSSWHGFFSWTPVAYIAALGTLAYARRRPARAAAALLILLLMAWVNGATADWAGGWSFGGRRFISMLVVLAPGLALVILALLRRPLVALAIVGSGAIVWNGWLVTQRSTWSSRDGSLVSFESIVREQAAIATRPPFVYPFAFPANAWFAWRTGLPIDAYDLLGPVDWRASLDLAMTADAATFLDDGWADQGRDPFGDFRWLEGERGRVALPLDPLPDRVYRLTISARTRLVHPSSPVILTVRIKGEAVGTITPPTDRASETTFRVPAALLQPGFNDLVFEKPSGTPPVAIYRIALEPIS